MKKNVFLLPLLFGACATPDRSRIVHIDSEPRGARVFFGVGPNEDRADTAKQFLGVTPLDWKTQANDDGSFEWQGIFIYSAAVRPAAVFTAEPPSGATNLHSKRVVYHGPAMFVPPDKIPEGIFFALAKPDAVKQAVRN